MIKNRVAQLTYRAIFLAISLFGIIESFGLFAGQTPNLECFVYYTSLSNFLCFGVMLAVFISTYRYVKNGQLQGTNTCCKQLKFYSSIAILVTFLVYNILLTDNMFGPGWNNLGNLTKHIICPLLFVLDGLLFDAHKQIKWYDTLLCTVLPLIYVAFILIRGAILPNDYTGVIYPYFFLDVNEIGIGKVFLWVLILLVIFIAIAWLFYVYDKLVKKDGKWKLDFSKNNVND